MNDAAVSDAVESAYCAHVWVLSQGDGVDYRCGECGALRKGEYL